MKTDIRFGDLVKVRGEWETAVRANRHGVNILTPPRPTMDGSANPGFRLVRYDMIEDHIRIAAVPGAIEALERIKTKLDALGTDLDGIYDDASAALRAVRGEAIYDETHRESVSASNKSHPD